jgi:uncharacterized protein
MNSSHGLIESIGDKLAKCEALPDLEQLLSPPFTPHRWVAGGHLQTVLSLRAKDLRPLSPTLRWVNLADGDRLAMQDDQPDSWQIGDPSVLVIHGLCGCSESPYMLRFASRFTRQGVRVFRLNLRGCGVGLGEAAQITHAGRSSDVIAALEMIAELTQRGPISAIGVSLGGNQLLRALGLTAVELATLGQSHLSASDSPASTWYPRLHRVAAISPPIDLEKCSDNMQRLSLRPYNRYFIRHLLQRVPDAIRNHPSVAKALITPPRTMRELDDAITAPLAGYSDAVDYYENTAAKRVIDRVQVPTLVLAASNDPIVPVSCFDHAARNRWPDHIRLVVTRCGGHVGFIGRGEQRHWMDGLLERWFEFDRTR